MVKKNNRLVIVNKYEESNEIDAQYAVERVFKMFYNLQIIKKVM